MQEIQKSLKKLRVLRKTMEPVNFSNDNWNVLEIGEQIISVYSQPYRKHIAKKKEEKNKEKNENKALQTPF